MFFLLVRGCEGVKDVMDLHSLDQVIMCIFSDPLGNNVKSIIAHSDSLDGEVTEYSVFYTPQEHGK